MSDLLSITPVTFTVQAGDATPPAKGGPEASTLVWLLLEDGQRVQVPASLVHRDVAGQWRLNVQVASATAGEAGSALPNATGVARHDDNATDATRATVVIPLVEERLHVTKHQVVGDTVRVLTHTTERQEKVELPVSMQTVDVTRVAINREIDQPVETRREGDTLIVPVVEEVFVVQKKLMLREEIRLTTRSIHTTVEQAVSLRRNEVAIDRTPATGLLSKPAAE